MSPYNVRKLSRACGHIQMWMHMQGDLCTWEFFSRKKFYRLHQILKGDGDPIKLGSRISILYLKLKYLIQPRKTILVSINAMELMPH